MLNDCSDRRPSNFIEYFTYSLQNETLLGRIANQFIVKADCSVENANDKGKKIWAFKNNFINLDCLILAHQHFIEVDSVKTGKHGKLLKIKGDQKYPDFMEKSSEFTYNSTKALGKIYQVRTPS